MRKSIAEILTEANKQPTFEGKVTYLKGWTDQTHATEATALLTIFAYAYADEVKFLLPEGPVPPYKPNTLVDQHGQLYSELRRLYLFIDGPRGNLNLKQFKREALFIEMLEKIDPKDAELLVAIKDKKMPEFASTITPKVVETVFPGKVLMAKRLALEEASGPFTKKAVQRKRPVNTAYAKKRKVTK